VDFQKRQIRFFAKGDLGQNALFVKILHKLFRASSERSNLLATYDIFDLSHQAGEVKLIKDNIKIGIVIQGPIVAKTTLGICEFYKRIYPQVQIVVSTWESENTDSFVELEDDHFSVIKTVKPISPGPSNINLQITSTINGVNLLLELGCTHILKTRTDVLLGNFSFLNYMIWMHSKGKKNAVVFSSFNSFLFRFFSPSDQVMFGEASDISRFWSINLVPENQKIDFPEKHLFKNYLESSGYETCDEFSNYLIALRDYTVIADHEQLGQIWNKGAFTALNYRWRGEAFPNQMSLLTSWHWEMLQNNEVAFFEKLYKSL
jgi:hypothetical protein